jgi:predicted dehydrogenase
MAVPYRVGIIGLSGISIAKPERRAGPSRTFLPHSHVSAYEANPRTDVVAVCNRSQGAIDRFRETWRSDATGYTDFREMLAQESIDLLSIATPDHLHADAFVAACDAGVKGIFCEKPVATTLEDVDRMIAAAKRSGTKAIVNHTRRFDPYYRHARWLIDEGTIGPVQQILGTLGSPEAMLFRNGSHLVDTMLFLANESPSWVMAVFDEIDAEYGPVYRGVGRRDPASDPSASAIIGFPSGKRAFYNGSKRIVSNFEFDVQGETGRIRIGNQIAEISTKSVLGGLATQDLPILADARAGMVQAIDELLALIEHDGDGLKALHEARTTVQVLLSILVSADRRGARITLDT